MNHGKQQILLYSLFLAISTGQSQGSALSVMSAPVSVLVAGSAAETYAFVARQVASEAMPFSSGSAAGTGGSSELTSNVSVTDFVNKNPELFEDVQPTSESSSSNDSGTLSPAEEKAAELRTSNDLVVHSWANNPAMIQYFKTSVPEFENVLQPLRASSDAPQQVSLQDYANTLYNATARQQYVFLNKLVPNLEPIAAADVEILAPAVGNSLVTAVPPVTPDVQFLPKQKMYMLISYLVNPSAATSTVQTDAYYNALAELNYVNTVKGHSGNWGNLSDKAKSAAADRMRGIVAKMKTNFGKIQESIIASLQAQNAADQKAQSSAISIWKEFQNQFNIAKDTGVWNWMKYQWSGEQNPGLNKLFLGTELTVVQRYVEGALEVLVYDLVVYSSIAKMSENELSTKFAKRYVESSSQKMLYFMLFGAASAAVLADPKEDSLKNRLKASYLAMRIKMQEAPEASSQELFKVFAELVWYSVTGKVLTLDPKKYGAVIKSGSEVQEVAKDAIDEPEEFVENLVTIEQLVKDAMLGITASQAFGLNFNQAPADFIVQIQKLNADTPNESLNQIASLVQTDDTAALALQAILFEVAATATALDKGKYYGSKLVNAVADVGQAIAKAVTVGDGLDGFSAPIVADLQEHANTEVAVLEDQVKTGRVSPLVAMQRVDTIVQVQTALVTAIGQELQDAAAQAKQVEEAAAVLDVSPDATTVEFTSAYRRLAVRYHPDKSGDRAMFERVQLAYETMKAAQQRGLVVSPAGVLLIPDFTTKLLTAYQEMQDQFLASVQSSFEAVSLATPSLVTPEDQRDIARATRQNRRAIKRAMFQTQVTSMSEVLLRSLKKLRIRVVTGNDVVKVLRTGQVFKGLTVGSDEMRYLQGYLQALVLLEKEVVQDAQVSPVVDVLRAVVRG